MNITDLIKVLSEEMAIEKFDKAVEGKVDPSALAALAAKMKKGKYNNIALAILKGIQSSEADEEHRKYLESHASQAYAVLRQMAKNNSSFNAASVVDEYLKSEKPASFWRDKYVENKDRQPSQKKEELGLSGARSKETKDWYLIFPRSFYEDYFFMKKEDMDKGWQELKAISDEMAKRDKTKSENAKVNHWCVAASSNSFFKNYKRNGGVFVVLVKKGRKGEPNWNNRYLWYCDEYGRNVQFANKFDKYKYPSDVLKDDNEALGILNKIKNSFYQKSKEGKNRQINRNEVIKNYKTEAKKNLVHPTTKEERTKLDLYRKTSTYNKLLRFAEKAREDYGALMTYTFVEHFKGKNIVDTIKKESAENYRNHERFTYREYTCFPNTEGGFWLKLVEPKKDNSPYKFYLVRPWGGEPALLAETNRDATDEQIREAIIAGLKEAKPSYRNDKENIESVSNNYLTIKGKPDYSGLHNNKYSEAFTKKMLDDESKGWGDNRGISRRINFPFRFYITFNDNGIFVYDKGAWSSRKLCDITDPDAVSKVREEYKKYLNEVIPGFKPKF